MGERFKHPEKVRYLQELFSTCAVVEVEGFYDSPTVGDDDDGWTVDLCGDFPSECWTVSDLNLDEATMYGNTGIRVPFKNYDPEEHESRFITITFLQEREIIDKHTVKLFRA